MSNLSLDQKERIRKVLNRVSSPFYPEAKSAAVKVYEMLSSAGACLEELKPQNFFLGVRDVGFDEYAERCQMIWAELRYTWKPYIPPQKITHSTNTNSGPGRQEPKREAPRPERERQRTDFYTDSSGRTYGHRNHFTGEEYKGKNQDILEDARVSNGWSSYEWAGFAQIASAGLSIKGQKSTLIEKWFPVKDENGEIVYHNGRAKMGHKILRVFNMSQVQGEYTGKKTKWRKSA